MKKPTIIIAILLCFGISTAFINDHVNAVEDEILCMELNSYVHASDSEGMTMLYEAAFKAEFKTNTYFMHNTIKRDRPAIYPTIVMTELINTCDQYPELSLGKAIRKSIDIAEETLGYQE